MINRLSIAVRPRRRPPSEPALRDNQDHPITNPPNFDSLRQPQSIPSLLHDNNPNGYRASNPPRSPQSISTLLYPSNPKYHEFPIAPAYGTQSRTLSLMNTLAVRSDKIQSPMQSLLPPRERAITNLPDNHAGLVRKDPPSSANVVLSPSVNIILRPYANTQLEGQKPFTFKPFT